MALRLHDFWEPKASLDEGGQPIDEIPGSDAAQKEAGAPPATPDGTLGGTEPGGEEDGGIRRSKRARVSPVKHQEKRQKSEITKQARDGLGPLRCAVRVLTTADPASAVDAYGELALKERLSMLLVLTHAACDTVAVARAAEEQHAMWQQLENQSAEAKKTSKREHDTLRQEVWPRTPDLPAVANSLQRRGM